MAQIGSSSGGLDILSTHVLAVVAEEKAAEADFQQSETAVAMNM